MTSGNNRPITTHGLLKMSVCILALLTVLACRGPADEPGPTAIADGQTEIDLSWNAPSDDGGADITGYCIEVSTDGSTWSDLVANTNSTSTGHAHSGLCANSTRHYRVSAINSAGTCPASNVDSATTDSHLLQTVPAEST